MTDNVVDVVRLLRFPRATAQRRLGVDAIRLFADSLRVLDIAILLVAGGLIYLAHGPSSDAGFRLEYGRNLLLTTIFLPFGLERTGCYRPARLDRLGGLASALMVGCVLDM